jgi:predicted nuclease of predicted toxin-antitoxin system
MKIKWDENLTAGLVPVLNKVGHDVQTTIEEGLTGKLDGDIWHAAQSEERFLMTQDMDFSDIRVFAPGSHQAILLLRPPSPNQAAIIFRVTDLFSNENAEAWRLFRCGHRTQGPCAPAVTQQPISLLGSLRYS